MKPRRPPTREKKFVWAKIALENIAHSSKVLGACMIPFLRVAHCPKKISVPSKTSVAQWLERRRRNNFFLLAWVQFPPRETCKT